jgi:hypothetical protein
MYVELLSTVLDAESGETADERFLPAALDCRARMLDVAPRGASTAHHALANEISYDRALIKLCRAKGVDAVPARFAHPRAERARLERKLAAAGIDLVVLTDRRLHRS